MTPREFLEMIVRPNVEEFGIHVDDLRYAHNAIASVDALAAHLFVWALSNNPAAAASARRDDAYRAKLAERNQDFALLRDIAKSQKHVHLTQGNPQVTHADQVTSRGIAFGEGAFGAGRFGGVPQVVVDIDASNFVYVEAVLVAALAFLEAEMRDIGA